MSETSSHPQQPTRHTPGSTPEGRLPLHRTACFNCRASRLRCDRQSPWYVWSIEHDHTKLTGNPTACDVPLNKSGVSILKFPTEAANKGVSSKSSPRLVSRPLTQVANRTLSRNSYSVSMIVQSASKSLLPSLLHLEICNLQILPRIPLVEEVRQNTHLMP
jgi:hypothetical protein